MITKDIQRLRSYQSASLAARARGIKRFVEVWHRRAGKDRTWMTITASEMLRRKGVYFHFLPTLGQARRSVWDNIVFDQYDGIESSYKLIDAVFPPELRAKKPNETEMQIELINGSIWQLMGAENQDAIDRARGSNPIGLVCSEHAFMAYDPWKVLSPVLAENGGWIAFISTPNVEDDNFHKLYQGAMLDPNWFAQLLTIEDTRRDAHGEAGTPVISFDEVQSMRASGIAEEEIQREYYCSFKGYMRGTIYGDVIDAAEQARRIGTFPYIPQLPVGVCFDLGHSDAMALWFYQIQGDGVYFIDYWEDVRKDIKDAVHFMRERRQYLYGRMVLPWDGHAAANYLELAGFKNIVVCQRNRMEATGEMPASVQEQIGEVRLQFTKFYFDNTVRVEGREGAGAGLDHLKKYKRVWNVDKQSFDKEPLHDAHSHGADALRTGMAGGFGPVVFPDMLMRQREITVENTFDPRVTLL